MRVFFKLVERPKAMVKDFGNSDIASHGPLCVCSATAPVVLHYAAAIPASIVLREGNEGKKRPEVGNSLLLRKGSQQKDHRALPQLKKILVLVNSPSLQVFMHCKVAPH